MNIKVWQPWWRKKGRICYKRVIWSLRESFIEGRRRGLLLRFCLSLSVGLVMVRFLCQFCEWVAQFLFNTNWQTISFPLFGSSSFSHRKTGLWVISANCYVLGGNFVHGKFCLADWSWYILLILKWVFLFCNIFLSLVVRKYS